MQLYLENSSTDPYLNMAVEEFLLHHCNEPVFHVWQNEPSVIIGRNQLADAEVNLDFIRKNDIKLVRRFSGGGAVYQDLGNINLTFINSNGNLDFDTYNLKVMDFLTSLHLQPTSNQRRAIFINEMKVSGSSQHIRGQKVIYHATLLFSSNLDFLNRSLQGKDMPEMSSKYVKSVKCPVTNLADHLPPDFTIEEFKQLIIRFFTGKDSRKIIFTEKETQEILVLKDFKYTNPNWINDGIL